MSNPIWPFAQLKTMTEACEWLTDVVQAKQAESRELIREYPVRELQIKHVLSPEQVVAARTLSRQGVLFRVPDWAVVYKTQVATGIAVPFEDGDCIVWRAWDDYEVVAVASGVLGAVSTAGVALVMPLLECRVEDAWKNSRSAGRWSSMTMSFQTTDGEDFSDDSRYDTWSDYSFVTDAQRVGDDSIDEGTEWDLASQDNGVAMPVDVILRDYADETFTAAWRAARGSDWESLRAWIYSRAGRYTPFWLPSHARELLRPVVSSSTLLVDNYDTDEEYIAALVDGIWYARHVESSSYELSRYVLTLDEALPSATVSYACYLRLVRFSADRIEIDHTAGQSYLVKVECVRVPIDE